MNLKLKLALDWLIPNVFYRVVFFKKIMTNDLKILLYKLC